MTDKSQGGEAMHVWHWLCKRILYSRTTLFTPQLSPDDYLDSIFVGEFAAGFGTSDTAKLRFNTSSTATHRSWQERSLPMIITEPTLYCAPNMAL